MKSALNRSAAGLLTEGDLLRWEKHASTGARNSGRVLARKLKEDEDAEKRRKAEGAFHVFDRFPQPASRRLLAVPFLARPARTKRGLVLAGRTLNHEFRYRCSTVYCKST